MTTMKVFAIRHKPTGAYMPTRMWRGNRGGWSYWIPGPAPDGWGGYDGFDKNPRIFFTLQSARNALTAWLLGVHSRQFMRLSTWDGVPDDFSQHDVQEPPVPRVREDMEIVPLKLAGLK